MTETNQPETPSVPTDRLKLHPLLRSMPLPPEEITASQALQQHIEVHGVTSPILITADREIIEYEGLRVWSAADNIGIAAVPVHIVPADSVALTIARGLTLRRHFTKGQLAYLAWPLVQPIMEEAKRRRLDNLRKGLEQDDSPILHSVQDRGLETVDDVARHLNLSRRTLDQARELHAEADKDRDLKAHIEEAVFVANEGQGHGLGAIIAGLAGYKATRGKPRNDPAGQLVFDFRPALNSARTFIQRWSKPEIWSDPTRRQEAEAKLQEIAAECDPAALANLTRTLNAALRQSA